MTEAQKDYNWLQAIIDSCNNTFHFECADKMIELFIAKHNNANLIMCLHSQREAHYNAIHSILN